MRVEDSDDFKDSALACMRTMAAAGPIVVLSIEHAAASGGDAFAEHSAQIALRQLNRLFAEMSPFVERGENGFLTVAAQAAWDFVLAANEGVASSPSRPLARLRAALDAYDALNRREAPQAPGAGDEPAAPAVDFAAVAAALRADRKPNPAKLVEFMGLRFAEGRTTAPRADVGREVHGSRNAGEGAIRKNAARTTLWLAEHRHALAFQYVGGEMHMKIIP